MYFKHFKCLLPRIGLEKAAKRAIEDINDSKILPGLKLSLDVAYGNCQSHSVIREFIKLAKHPSLFGVIGPACSETIDAISGISAAMNVPIVSYAAEGGSFANRISHPFVYRAIGDSRQ